ncbi:hypothetical protein [Spongiactinospora sp. TRM90649]|uniref:hypothetical protein n=1 Tax=Spongiactinospora sp. TRM90649 TaxID=3031114 RepID=UPI0023F92992|nr:hypothetical protein [Spongiactinospora sp. TRM90649]MDF5757051.1 hypothetical protein [Spongiactinospora sp. TRM90649]
MHSWLRLGARLPGGLKYRRRLAALAENGDEAALLAMIGHVRRGHFREWLADLWVRTRDERLRALVIETGAVGSYGRNLQITQALHGRLPDRVDYQAALNVAVCVEDPDDAVRSYALTVCATAGENLLDMLWRAAAGRPALRDALLANPAPLTGVALGWAWRSWLDRPDDALWERLAGQGEPSPRPDSAFSFESEQYARTYAQSMVALGLAPPDRLAAAAVSGEIPEHLRERAARICREREPLPAQPVRAAVFHLLTGAPERYQEVDPDGSLLATGYARTRGPLRARLREAMLGAQGLDLVRAMTGERRGRLTPDERAYLVRELAISGSWAELWRLLPVLPFDEALAAVRRIRDWRPDDEREAALFDRLTAPSPALAPLVIEVGDREVRLAFTAGGARLYVADAETDVRDGVRADVYSMWRRGRVRTATWRGARVRGRILAMAASGAGFAALTSRDHLLLAHRELREVPLQPLTGDSDHIALAAHRRTGRLAVLGHRLAVLERDADRVVTAGERVLRERDAGQVAFLRAQGMAVATRAGMLAMNMGDVEPREVRVPFLSGPAAPEALVSYDGGARLAASSGGRIVFAALDLVSGEGDQVEEPRLRLPAERVSGVWSSPGGEYLALRTGNAIEVHGPFFDEGDAMLRRPLAELSREHLAEAARMHARLGHDCLPGWRFGLLVACLEHTYGGDAAPPRGRARARAGAQRP